MKKVFFLVSILLLAACKKDSTKPVGENEVKATIQTGSGSPVSFVVTGANAKIYPFTTGSSLYKVEATNTNHQYIFLAVFDVTSPGTYTLSPSPYGSNCYYSNNLQNTTGSDDYFSFSAMIPGSVTITSLTSHHIEGTFITNCKNNNTGITTAITQGSFKGNF